MVLTNQVFRKIVTDDVVYTGELVQIFAMITSNPDEESCANMGSETVFIVVKKCLAPSVL